MSLLEDLIRTDLDKDNFGIAVKKTDEISKSFFYHFGLKPMEKGKNIPFIDTREEALHKKVNTFFDIARNAMNRKSDLKKVFMTKEIIHFELFGPGKSKSYFDRIKEHEEEEKRRKIEIERKEVKSTFQKVQISTEGHEGVNKTTSKWA